MQYYYLICKPFDIHQYPSKCHFSDPGPNLARTLYLVVMSP